MHLKMALLLYWFQTEVQLYVSLWENGSTSHWLYYLSKRFSNEFLISFTSFKSSSLQTDIQFVNHGPIKGKKMMKQGML